MNEIYRSPFFYVGDKYKLMSQLKKLMPQNIGVYIEPFAGGGSSLINTNAKKYIANDIDKHVIELHQALSKYAQCPDELLSKLYSIIDKYGLSCSYRGICVPNELKRQYVKTYYSRFNKESYSKLRDDYNKDQDNMLMLYILLIYGFNHMIRFNRNGDFNLPVGNVDFNKNVYNSLLSYLNFMQTHDVEFFNKDYKDFLSCMSFDKSSFVFFDPPYLISMSEYNKLWNETKEKELCALLDELNSQGVLFGITNLTQHKGQENKIFIEWSQKYIVHSIKSNYISFNDNTIKETSKEVYVTNYEHTQF